MATSRNLREELDRAIEAEAAAEQAIRSYKPPELKLKYDVKKYKLQALEGGSMPYADKREEYARLRKIVTERQRRITKAGFQSWDYEAPATLKEIKNERELDYELSGVVRKLSSRSFSLTYRRLEMRRTIASLRRVNVRRQIAGKKELFHVPESVADFNKYVEFWKAVDASAMRTMYPSEDFNRLYTGLMKTGLKWGDIFDTSTPGDIQTAQDALDYFQQNIGSIENYNKLIDTARNRGFIKTKPRTLRGLYNLMQKLENTNDPMFN